MNAREEQVATAPTARWSKARDYFALTKPKVVSLIMFTAIVGMFLAVPGLPPAGGLVWGTIGIALAASSAAAINHVLDWRIDAEMARTRRRPLPRGAVSEAYALSFAFVLGAGSMLILAFSNSSSPQNSSRFDMTRSNSRGIVCFARLDRAPACS